MADKSLKVSQKKKAISTKPLNGSSFPYKRNSSKTKIIANKNINNKIKYFPIVAVGASAGGLEAYQTFLNNLAPDTGMAYVFIQHLSADFKSMMLEILKRETRMEVLVVLNKMIPQENKVYVIPPKYNVTIEEGVFYLTPRRAGQKINRPIDIFMSSLGEDHFHYAIGVIMSGTDSDGVVGLGRIKSSGGITFAQNKKTAKFFEMPKHAIDAGVIDYILAPEEIAKDIKHISSNLKVHIPEYSKHDDTSAESDYEITKILNTLYLKKNINFKEYKPTTVKRRILRRMLLHKIKNVEEYSRFISKNPDEIISLCEDILINVTSFFRDPNMYKVLIQKVFPALIKDRPSNKLIRIWITACSTGEEAYSIAILLSEFLGEKISKYPFQIFSTDLSEAGVEKARRGIYSNEIQHNVSKNRLKKYFTKLGGKFQINKSIRDVCVFARQNLVQDPPFSNIDLISCRNVLIYFGPVLQSKVLPVFHYALKPTGFLVLGSSETVGSSSHLFIPVDRKNKIYIKNPNARNENLDFNFDLISTKNRSINQSIQMTDKTQDFEFQKETERLLLRKYTPEGVVINRQMEIIHFKGGTEPYFEIPQGSPSYNISKMAREGLRSVLKNGIDEAFKKNISIKKNNVQFYYNQTVRNVNIIFEPILNRTGTPEHLLILFENTNSGSINDESKPLRKITKGSKESMDLASIKKELEIKKQHLHSLIEQLELTNEELRYANEKTQSYNEELHTTNEELETTKEELQSTNEELITVNDELQNRNVELGNTNTDLYNILGSIKIFILLLDNNLRIKRFTNEASKLLNLIPGDIGRKLSDINTNIKIKDLKSLVKDVIQKSSYREMEVQDDFNGWYSMRIRPYKTLKNKTEGVIITFIDITEIRKRLKFEESFRKKANEMNIELEKKVKTRTAALEKSNRELGWEIVDRKKAETSLKSMSKDLVYTQETERLNLSRELHDGVNQILSAAKLQIYTAESLLKRGSDKRNLKNIVDAKKYIISAIEEIRRLSHGLRPASLDDLGVIPALKLIIQDFVDRNKIKIKLELGKIRKRLSSEVEITLYRIVQEYLNNIEKHAHASNVKIRMSIAGKTIRLSISDDGVGFKFKEGDFEKKRTRKLGLIGIKERTEIIGGKFNIKSTSGTGTNFDVTIPVKFMNENKK